MKYWIVSDTHFEHLLMTKGGHRPEGYEDKIYGSIQDNVKYGDILIHLGDIVWKNEALWNDLMNVTEGKTWLIKGNHDKHSNAWYLSKGWDFVADTFSMKRHGKKVLFSHKPQPKTDAWDINVHGHLHLTGHRDEEYQDIKHEGHCLIEMESFLGVRDMDRVIQKKIEEMN